jgi:hypothetical protein
MKLPSILMTSTPTCTNFFPPYLASLLSKHTLAMLSSSLAILALTRSILIFNVS